MPIAPAQGGAVKRWPDTATGEALEQLKNVARLPITYAHVAATPDVHYGRERHRGQGSTTTGGGVFNSSRRTRRSASSVLRSATDETRSGGRAGGDDEGGERGAEACGQRKGGGGGHGRQVNLNDVMFCRNGASRHALRGLEG